MPFLISIQKIGRLMQFKHVFFSITFVLLFTLSGNSQFSFYTKYQPNNIEWQDEWQSAISPDVIYGQSLYYGLSYWLRLKEYRVEFHPSLYVTSSKQTITPNGSIAGLPDISSAAQNGFGFEVPVQFYFLDIVGDCNCPTFSKDGTFIDKGLYAYINPGVRRIGYEFNAVNSDGSIPERISDENQTYFTLAGGFGLDIGLGDLFTITPFGGLEFAPNLTSNTLNEFIETASGNAAADSRNLRSIVTGLRLSFRPDYLRDKKAMYR